jgi:hypothetical protein
MNKGAKRISARVSTSNLTLKAPAQFNYFNEIQTKQFLLKSGRTAKKFIQEENFHTPNSLEQSIWPDTLKHNINR